MCTVDNLLTKTGYVMLEAAYSFKSPLQQLFSFPLDVIRSMLENPSSPKGLMKLYQTCKYFYGKQPILIAPLVDFIEQRTTIGKFYNDVSNIKVPVWPTNEINFNECFNPHQLLVKLFCYSAIKKIFLYRSNLQFNDFVLFTSTKSITEFNVYHRSTIYHSDGSQASLEQILQHLPNIKYLFYYIDEKCSAQMLAKLNAMKFNQEFRNFQFHVGDRHPTFDLKVLCEFVMNNSHTDFCIHLHPNDEYIEKWRIAISKLGPQWNAKVFGTLQNSFVLKIDKNFGKEN